MGQSKEGKRYYYAGGKRVELADAPDRLAVLGDLRATSSHRVAKAIEQGQALPQGLVLIDCKSLDAKERQELENAYGSQPVFEFENSVVVALPEVRVEEQRPQKRRALNGWLKKHRKDLEYDKTDSGRLTVRPNSHHGLDALQMAADLNEQLELEMAQPRFIRIVAHPQKK